MYRTAYRGQPLPPLKLVVFSQTFPLQSVLSYCVAAFAELFGCLIAQKRRKFELVIVVAIPRF